MSAFLRARIAITSAAKGWSCVWVLLIVWSSASFLLPKNHISLVDQLSVLLIWIICTGIVTLATTILLVVPYVCVVGGGDLRYMPWRMYIGPCVIASLVSIGLNYRLKPHAETFWRSLPPYLIFALLTSLTSSAFYVHRIKVLAARGAVTQEI
jgi:hypothetical protein